jgi:hypothetical protein
MAAISEELVFRETPRATEDDGPEVSVVEGPAGRETLALIEGEARPPRSRQSTIGYGDRISNAPGAKTPSQPAKIPSHAPVAKPSSRAPAAKTPSHAPAVKPSRAPAVKAPSRAPATAKAPTPIAVTPVIFEMLTFVVQGADVASLASESQRQRFVETHLLHRLPDQNMAQVDRVDVTPWTVKDTVVVRVWCKI